MAKKSKITEIKGPLNLPSRNRFYCTWKQDGKNRQYSRQSKKDVEKKISSLEKQAGFTSGNLEAELLSPIASFDPTPAMFKQLTADIIKASHQATLEGNLDALKRLKEYSTIVSTMSKSYQPWSELHKTVDEFEKLISYHESTDKQTMREGSFASKQESRESIEETLETDQGSPNKIFRSSN